MSITKEQKEFIKKVAPGIDVYMSTCRVADAIWTNPITDVELYIEEHLLEYKEKAIFSEEKFRRAVDILSDEKLKDLLLYFDKKDMPLCDMYIESCLATNDFTTVEGVWEQSIMDGNLHTFEDFLNLSREKKL